MKHYGPAAGIAIAAAIGQGVIVPAAAAQEAEVGTIEEVVVVGSRRPGRTVAESMTPVDVLNADSLRNQGATDMDDMLRNLIPSYNVDPFPISDAATLVRPATLRGLPPDNTLVLMNGKRFHRSAVIALLGDASAGSQGPDMAAIPSIALEQVEVLRDGASAQYGSDAIAGVINFRLRDDAEGFTLDAKTGAFFEGDGEQYQVAANWGTRLGSDGFLNLSAEWTDQDDTVRSVQRSDAAALIASGNDDVRDPAQIWGIPFTNDSVSLVANLGSPIEIPFNSEAEFYAFAGYHERSINGGFFFRNPNTRSGVFASGGNRLVGDLTPDGTGNCPVLPVPDLSDPAAVAADQAALAALGQNPDCFTFNGMFPGGFTPRFGGDINDAWAYTGIRGLFENGVNWDFSLGLGRNEVEFFIDNTVNASLGPRSPTNFRPGDFIQLEKVVNLDLSYPIELDVFASPVNVAAGVQWHEEQFETVVGELASFEQGPLADQGFGIGSNGFQGFSPNQAGQADRASFAIYGDIEVDVTQWFTLGGAVRHEDFDDVGTETTGKVSASVRATDWLMFRGTWNTGFRAPTIGQTTLTNTSTTLNDANVLVSSGLIPPTNPIAEAFGGQPLEPETSDGFSVGMSVTYGALTLTADYFQIDIDDRITQGADIEISPELAAELEATGVPGASQLSEIRFFTNDFDTETEGVDVVASYPVDWNDFGYDIGTTDFSVAFNWTETDILSSNSNLIDRERTITLEDQRPDTRTIVSATHLFGPVRVLLRATRYGEWLNGDNNPADDIQVDAEWLLDAEVEYTFRDRYSVVLGGTNLTDEEGVKDPEGTISGNKFLTDTPFGFNGAFWYTRLRVEL